MNKRVDRHRQAGGAAGPRIAAIVLLLVAAAVLLDRLPSFLISEDRWDKADYVLILGSGICAAEAAQWYREGRVEHILLVERWQQPAVRLKILPTFEEHAGRILTSSGVPSKAIELISANVRDSWDTARVLGPWLTAHPRARIDVLTERLSSGREQFVFRSVLGPQRAGQLRVFGLPDPGIVERGWWHHRYSLKAVTGACLGLVFDYLHGPPPEDFQTRDPVAYANKIVDEYGQKGAASQPEASSAAAGNDARSRHE